MCFVFFSIRRRHTICALVTGVQTCALPIWPLMLTWVDIGDPVAFQEKQDKRDSVFDPVWRLFSNMVRPVPAVIAIMIAAVLFGWSFWKGEELKVGDSQAGENGRGHV